MLEQGSSPDKPHAGTKSAFEAGTDRPCPLVVKPDAIPQELRDKDHWLVWKYVKDLDSETGEISWDKPPVSARTGGPGSSTNPKTWDSYQNAYNTYLELGYDGIGFALHARKGEELHVVAIDLDKCRNADTGTIDEWALDIIRAIDSYTEISPSGCGIRILLFGALPAHGRKKGPYENYQTGRYVTITGHHLDGTPHTIENRHDQLLAVHKEQFGEQGNARAANDARSHAVNLDDRELLERAFRSKSGNRIRALYNGDTSGYSSKSEADLALCNYLAFWFGRDADRILQIITESGLYRSKWQREDYQRRTIGKAIAGCQQTYEPRQRNGTGRPPPPAGDGDGHREDAELKEGPDDPHRLARIFLDDHSADGLHTLHYWREEWYRFDGTAWRVWPLPEVRAALSARVKAQFNLDWQKAHDVWEQAGGVNNAGKQLPEPVVRKVTTRLLGDVTSALAGLAVLPGSVCAPSWLSDDQPFPANEILVCKNLLVHLPTWAAGRPSTQALTPALFSTNALDYAFDPKAPQPAEWLAFLNTLWPEDAQAVETLQTWFGYSLLPDTSQQKILMIVGPRRSGKGTIARVLRAVVGIHNTVGPTLAGLATNFGLSPLLDKMLAIISDARLSGRTDSAIVVERLLSISGEDAQTCDRKNLSHVTAKLNVRFVILTNELPRLSDASGALAGRFIILRQTRSWFGKEDTGLTDRLLKELPAILLWSMRGWQRLQDRGRFIQPASAERVLTDLEDLVSPIGAFIRETCEIGQGYEVLVRDLFNRWKAWCEEKGRKDHGTEQVFGRDLRAVMPSLDIRQPRIGGERVRCYLGLRLLDNEEEVTGEHPFRETR
jgi:P4 family phage/plasmid primase-like protien